MNATLMIGAVLAQMLVRPWSQTNVPLDERVAADFKDKQADAAFVHYDVPPMSGVQRLPDVYPHDGVAGGTVGIVMAQDEYEPGSFLVYPKKDLGKVELEVGEFKDGTGDVFPAADLDLKVVKVWYQNENAWYSYFGDTGAKLVPEMLLNDEDLIRVDTAKKANYARITEKDGKVHEQWINPPRQLDRSFWDCHRGGNAFSPMKPSFADADTLQPVTLRKGEFKQFFLTAHARKETKPGVYRGEIKIKSKSKGEGEQRIGVIPVSIRVMDFVLPKPMCYFDDSRPFYVNFYSYDCYGMYMEQNGGDLDLARRQLKAVLADYAAHGQDVCKLRWGFLGAEGAEYVKALREAGFRDDLSVAGAPIASQGGMIEELESLDRRSYAAAKRVFGHGNVYVMFGDEPPAYWLKGTRDVLKAAQKAGYKFLLAGSDNVYRKAGYQYDWHNINKIAEDDSTARLWNQFGSSPVVAWYSKQHVGVENPDFNRRQNGMAAYLSGYSALCNYAHHFGPYNDDSAGYKPMVFAYGHGKGVIDTLQWEGFREGLDDIRYATKLVKLARAAAKSKDVDTRYTGNKALQFLASFRKDADSLDACRMEMIRHIQQLLNVSK